jgi:N-dimethylarginine dimethylaminohydrolase
MITCHSESGTLQRVFLQRPASAFKSPEKIAAEWRALHFLDRPDLAVAIQEYRAFESALSRTNTQLMFLEADGLSLDSLYCRDASIATDGGMILCNMGKPNRVAEPAAARFAFEKQNIPVLGAITLPGKLEGGDVAWLDTQTLAVGHTYRTNLEGIAQLQRLVAPLGVSVIVVELPHYKGPSDVFHLMSIFSPVDRNLAVVYSPLMPIAFRQLLLKRGYELVEVPDVEFESMGCNVLALGPRDCLMVNGNPKTAHALRLAGCRVTEYEGQHISVLGGGGPTCLTRPLQREVV